MDKTEFLLTCPIFEGVDRKTVEHWADKFSLHSYEDGAALYRTKKKLHYLYIIVDGKVRFDYILPEGTKFIIYLSEDKVSLGEVELLNNYDAIANATIVGPTRILQLKKECFFELMKHEPIFGLNVARLLSNHVRNSVEFASYHYLHSTEARLGRMLTQFSELAGKSSSGSNTVEFSVSLTHDDMANMIGATRQTVSKLMSQWKDKAWVDYKYGKITIKDKAALLRHIDEMTSR